MRKKIIVIGVLTALLLVYFNGVIPILKDAKQFKVLKAKAKSEASYIKDLQMLQAEKQKYYNDVIEVSNEFYTDGRLFSLWKHIGTDAFGNKFQRLSISRQYQNENGLKVFYITISARTDPISFVAAIKKIVPPLYLVQLTSDMSTNITRATYKGVILSDNNEFTITPELMKANSYIVCIFYMATEDKSLIPANSNYKVTQKNNMFYVGTPVASDLDILSAEAVAKSYAKKGIITFIMQANNNTQPQSSNKGGA